MSDVPGRLLRETLQAGMTGESPGCLDAETAARYADGALNRSERAAVESHAAGCARCQALLAAMARTAPPVVSRSWFRSPILAWAVPLTAVAAALLLYVQVAPKSRRAAPVDAREMEARQVRPTETDAVAAPTESGAVTALTENKTAAAPTGRIAKPSAERAPAADVQAKAAQRPADGPREAYRSGVTSAKAQQAQAQPPANAATTPGSAAETVAGAATAPVPQASPAPSRMADAATPPPAPVAPPAPRIAAAPSAPPAAASRDEASARGNAMQALALSSRRAPSTIVIPSSTASTRWRVISTVVQRSTDSGMTWIDTQPTGASLAPAAGASPSPSVCWLVGPQGLVLLSTDGRTWKRVVFPETVDLTSVLAIDATAATVTTADGRTFNTTDGGLSWIRR